MTKNHSKLQAGLALLAILIIVMLIQCSSQSLIPTARADASATLISDDSSLSAETSVGNGNFSIIWITDTQYLSESYPTYFDSLCRWIVNNAETYNVKMVIHTGDLVNDEWNTTQWANANRSMSLLLDAGVPYCWNAGNHDYTQTYWIGNQFVAFNPVDMSDKPYWVSDKFDGQNTAVHFTISDKDFLIVNISNEANSTVLNWANNLLDNNPDSHAIVATHFYLNRTGGYESWAANFKRSVLAIHSNVFLTLSAHVYPLSSSGIRTEVGDRQELVFNRQDKDNNMGAASLRILTFDTTHGVIEVKTFYIYANTFLTDSNNQFTLNTNFRNDLAPNEKEEIPEFSAAVLLALSLTVIVVVCVYRIRVIKRN